MEEFKNEETVEEGLSFRGFMLLLWRNVILIVLVTAVVTIAGLVFAVSKKPNYTATRSIMVEADSSNTENMVNTSNMLTRELPNIAEFFKQLVVIDRANDIYTAKNGGEISIKKIGTDYNTSTRFVSVSYTDSDPDVAVAKVDALVQAEIEVISSRNPDGSSQYFPLTITVHRTDNDRAVFKESSGILKYVVIAFVGGLVLGVIAALVRYFMDDKLRSKNELERITGVKILALIENGGEANEK